jgi:hypothetical protein
MCSPSNLCYLASFISPYIDSSSFPINFEVDRISTNQPIYPINLIMDPTFFKQISNSYEIVKFKKSNEYQGIKALFNLSDNKKLLEHFYKEYFGPLYFDSLNYFPFNDEKLDLDFWELDKHKQYIIAVPLKQCQEFLRRCKFQILGNLQAVDFLILRSDLESLMISDTLKVQFPYVSRNYLNKLLKSYLDLQYKFINIIRIMITFKSQISMFQTKFAYEALKNFETFKPKIFLYPDLGPKRSPILLANDNDELVVFYGKIDYGDHYVCIYSNTYPEKSNKIKEIKNDLQPMNIGEFIVEIKNNSCQSGG